MLKREIYSNKALSQKVELRLRGVKCIQVMNLENLAKWKKNLFTQEMWLQCPK